VPVPVEVEGVIVPEPIVPLL